MYGVFTSTVDNINILSKENMKHLFCKKNCILYILYNWPKCPHFWFKLAETFAFPVQIGRKSVVGNIRPNTFSVGRNVRV